jgi:hypothetical protein
VLLDVSEENETDTFDFGDLDSFDWSDILNGNISTPVLAGGNSYHQNVA